VHDEAKDKPFELELSWLTADAAAGGEWRHRAVPPERVAAADAWAKAQIEAEELGDDDDDEEMKA
jgi:20S proteasome subunit alpha 7